MPVGSELLDDVPREGGSAVFPVGRELLELVPRAGGSAVFPPPTGVPVTRRPRPGASRRNRATPDLPGFLADDASGTLCSVSANLSDIFNDSENVANTECLSLLGCGKAAGYRNYADRNNGKAELASG